MFKVTIKYPNFIGNEVEDTFRFNFTEDEMLKLAKDDPEFNAEYISTMMQEEEIMKMYMLLRKLVVLSYGVMSEDAKYFRKSDEITKDFMQSAAFDKIIDLFTGEEAEKTIQEFVYNVFPSKFAEELKKRNLTNAKSIEDFKKQV